MTLNNLHPEKKHILNIAARVDKTNLQHLFSIPVIVAALGYFVDIYALLLFGIVRLPSLALPGLNESEISAVGVSTLTLQETHDREINFIEE